MRLVQYITAGSLLMVAAYAADFLPVLARGPNEHLWDLRLVLLILVEILPFLVGGALVWRSLTL